MFFAHQYAFNVKKDQYCIKMGIEETRIEYKDG